MAANNAPARSMTGHHNLLPAVRPRIPDATFIQKPTYNLLTWTFGRGSVIWRIWPAVLLHTVFAAIIVVLQEKGGFKSLAIPNVMLTVLGVVIGFVISYRASSGYDRYWMGRTCWSDVIKNSRTMGRLIWYHVPPITSAKTPEERSSGKLERSSKEMLKVMAEKRMALDLLEGFAVALKHHLRGEVGLYYEDLYDLIRPLHEHDHTSLQNARAMSTSVAPPTRSHRITANPPVPHGSESDSDDDTTSDTNSQPTIVHTGNPKKVARFFGDPVIPPINAYGTFNGSSSTHLRRQPSQASQSSEHQPLAPAQSQHRHVGRVYMDLIPFAGLWQSIGRLFTGKKQDYLPVANDAAQIPGTKDPMAHGSSSRKWSPPLQPRLGASRHHPVDGLGENLPLEILRCLDEWFSVLEERNTTSSVGSMIATVSTLEDTLTALERILTTPLPFVYSVHISTVWIYLFFLPFQLIEQFNWYTIPGVCIAAFIYLGFLAAGEEIEQPFGYDENDLDLDMFCREVIHVDLENLKNSPCLNAYFPHSSKQQERPSHSRSLTHIADDEGDDGEEEGSDASSLDHV